MFCRSCGSELQDDWKACPKCGILVNPVAIIPPHTQNIPPSSGSSWGKAFIIIGFIIFAIYVIMPSQTNLTAERTTASILKPETPSNHVQVLPGWTWTADSYGYSKINGSIKNIGTKTISYFAVTAEYLNDEGKVLDTSYTNSIEKIQPGNEKRFEIMHKHSPDFKKARLFPSQVRTE